MAFANTVTQLAFCDMQHSNSTSNAVLNARMASIIHNVPGVSKALGADCGIFPYRLANGTSEAYFGFITLPGREWREYCKEEIMLKAIMHNCARENIRVWWKETGIGHIVDVLGMDWCNLELYLAGREDAGPDSTYPEIDHSCLLQSLHCLANFGERKSYPGKCEYEEFRKNLSPEDDPRLP